jgi:hypothetical protein
MDEHSQGPTHRNKSRPARADPFGEGNSGALPAWRRSDAEFRLEDVRRVIGLRLPMAACSR